MTVYVALLVALTCYLHTQTEVSFSKQRYLKDKQKLERRIASSGMLTPCGSCKNRRFGGT
jgi:hypothetical protein